MSLPELLIIRWLADNNFTGSIPELPEGLLVLDVTGNPGLLARDNETLVAWDVGGREYKSSATKCSAEDPSSATECSVCYASEPGPGSPGALVMRVDPLYDIDGACRCAAGYEGAATNCSPCPSGTFSDRPLRSCAACPANAAPDGDRASCVCIEGHEPEEGHDPLAAAVVCTPCKPGAFKDGKNREPCSVCSAGVGVNRVVASRQMRMPGLPCP